MAVQNRDQQIRMVVAGQKEVFTDNFKVIKTSYDRAVTFKESNKKAETYDSVGNLKAAEKKPEGAAINYGGIDQAYQTTITNETTANGYAVTFEAMDDDLYAAIKDAQASELARTMKVAEEKEAWGVYNNAFTTVGADGKVLCANDHPLKNSASVNDNLTTGALSPANVKTGLNLFNDFKNHAGDPFDCDANQIITHKNNMFTVQEILKSSNIAYEQSNTENVLPKLEEVYTKYLASQTAWFLRDKNIANVVFQWRKKTAFNEDIDKRSTLNIYLNAVARYKASFISPFGIVGSTGL